MPASRSSTSPIPSRCLGARSGSSGAVSSSTSRISCLVAPQRAADRDAVDAGLGDGLRRLASQVLVDAALDDPEDRLPRRTVLAMPLQAAVQPAVRALHRASGVVAVRVIGRALVEDQRDVGPELRLHLHRDLGREEQLAPVPVGAEPHPLLVDRDDGAMIATGPPLPLHLVGHPTVRQREHLKAAGVGDQRPLPPHELVQPPGSRDPIRPGRDEQVVRVPQHQLIPHPSYLARLKTAHRPLRGQRNERRRADRAVRASAAPRPAQRHPDADLEPQPVPIVPHARLVIDHRLRGSTVSRRSGSCRSWPRAGGCRGAPARSAPRRRGCRGRAARVPRG